MGADASKSCDVQKDKLERVVNVCCREDKIELSTTRFNVYQNERNRYSLDVDRKVSTSRSNPHKKHYEICCGCESEEVVKTSLIDQSLDNGRRRSLNESSPSRLSFEKKLSPQKHDGYHASGSGENHHKLPPPPPGWTESEILILKRAVEKAARIQQVRRPGYAAMQANNRALPLLLFVQSLSHILYQHQSTHHQLLSPHLSPGASLGAPPSHVHAAHPLTPPPPPPQVLRRARARAGSDRMLPGGEADGAYGVKFWAEVARGVPGRTMTQCLDGYIASHYSTVARFTAGVQGHG
jgi:hypothetical protein